MNIFKFWQELEAEDAFNLKREESIRNISVQIKAYEQELINADQEYLSVSKELSDLNFKYRFRYVYSVNERMDELYAIIFSKNAKIDKKLQERKRALTESIPAKKHKVADAWKEFIAEHRLTNDDVCKLLNDNEQFDDGNWKIKIHAIPTDKFNDIGDRVTNVEMKFVNEATNESILVYTNFCKNKTQTDRVVDSLINLNWIPVFLTSKPISYYEHQEPVIIRICVEKSTFTDAENLGVQIPEKLAAVLESKLQTLDVELEAGSQPE